MFRSIFDPNLNGLDIKTILICFSVGIVLGILIALSYKYTSKASKDFLITIATLPILVAVVMIMINGSLGTSIAILGAFSLVRFRSIPGTGKELLVVFFSMAVGLALGMGHLFFATVFTIVTCGLLIIFDKVGIFSENKNEQILKIVVPEDMDYSKVFEPEFKKYTVSHKIFRTKTVNMGSLYKVSYRVILKNKVKEKDFLDAIRVKNCNLQVLLSSEDDENMI